jgi:hypothetical protein
VNTLTPQECADLWYLKYEHKWITHNDLPDDWRAIGNKLKRADLAQYELVMGAGGYKEIIKLKEN